MNITRENTGDYSASFTIEITPEDYLPKVNQSLNEIRKKANIPGFRPGKAPIGIVRRQYLKSSILEEINNIAHDTISKHIEESDFKIIGRPLLNTEKTPVIEDIKEDANYLIVFDIGIIPEFEAKLEEQNEVTYKKVVVTDAVLEKEIESLKKKNASFDTSEIVDENCMITGHVNVIDSSVEQTDETKEQNKHHRYFFYNKIVKNDKIQQKFFVAKKGDTIEIKAEDIEDREALSFLFPESIDFSNPNISVSFDLADIYTTQPAELNEELFNKVFPNYGITEVEDFKKTLKTQLEYQFEHQCDDIFLHQVRKQLIKDINPPLPADFVKKFLIENSKNQEEFIKELDEKFDNYLDLVKWEFIQERIFKNYEITIGVEDIKAHILDFYSKYLNQTDITDEQLDVEVKHLLQDQKRIDEVEETIRRNKTVEIFKSKLTIKEEIFESFEDLVAKEEKN